MYRWAIVNAEEGYVQFTVSSMLTFYFIFIKAAETHPQQGNSVK